MGPVARDWNFKWTATKDAIREVAEKALKRHHMGPRKSDCLEMSITNLLFLSFFPLVAKPESISYIPNYINGKDNPMAVFTSRYRSKGHFHTV
jgi:hypothetical protein